MTRIFLSLSFAALAVTAQAQDVTECGTYLKDIAAATVDELSTEYQRLKSYSNPYCDTTNSDFHRIMKTLAEKQVAAKATPEAVQAAMGTPYFAGTLADYENQKVTVGRDGKMIGNPLPPQYKVPAGDYYVVYFWRKKDYLIYAFKAGKASAQAWWEKGKY